VSRQQSAAAAKAAANANVAAGTEPKDAAGVAKRDTRSRGGGNGGLGRVVRFGTTSHNTIPYEVSPTATLPTQPPERSPPAGAPPPRASRTGPDPGTGTNTWRDSGPGLGNTDTCKLSVETARSRLVV
jgi:hypothetical protein